MRYLLNMSLFVLPVLFLYLFIRISLIKRIKFNIIRDILRIAFAIYISSLIFIVWIDSSIHKDYLSYNIIPFKTIISYIKIGMSTIGLKNIIGNIIITAPLGFFAFCKVRIIPKINIVMYSLIIPFIIELVQFLLYLQGFGARSVDIDDIILNSLGILAGYFLTKLLFGKQYIRYISTL